MLHLSLKCFSFDKQFTHNTRVKYNLDVFFSTSIVYYKDDILGCDNCNGSMTDAIFRNT